MESATRFRELLELLSDHRVESVIVGGVAAVLLGAPVSTFDLDLLFRRTLENAERLVEALATVGAACHDPAGREIRPTVVERLQTHRLNLLDTRLGRVDLLATIGDGVTYEDVLPRSVPATIGRAAVSIVDLATLIAAKEHAGREKDLAVLPLLRTTLRLRQERGLEQSRLP